ncbi:MAG: hypothetical protein P8M04_07525 [Akkermansiaceae bacterium]|nr:hypothetical protein [Akkermansiaceae bacterium]
MKFRNTLLLSLTLISASAQKPLPLSFATKITPEMIQVLEVQNGQASPSKAPRPPKAPQTPEQQRTKMLQGLKIDRTTSGILGSRLTEKNEAGKASAVIPKMPADPEVGPPENPQIKKQREDKAKLAAFKNDFNTFTFDVTLGRWGKVKDYLAALPSGDATLAFRQIVTQLSAPVTVRPRKELTSLGAKQHQQQQYLRPEEFLALTDASQKAPDNSILPQLAGLIKGNRKPPRDFFATLAKGTRYFGLGDEETKARTARLLIEAEHLDETTTFLPSLKEAKEKKNHAALNLLGRYYAESYSANRDGEHLENAWQISLGIISEKKAPLNERAEALYRALALVPDLEDGTGSDWLTETFANASAEGFEILATVGAMASQVREHRSTDFRLEQLKLQTAAVVALTSNEKINLKPWQEILTLYVRNWNAEAERSYRLDTSNSMRPQAQVDAYGNLFYSRYKPPVQQTSSRNTPAIPSGDLLRTRPDEQWLAQVDSPVQLENIVLSAKLFLKVKEEEKAFPILKKLAKIKPDESKELVREMIRVWAENNNPNQQSRYRSSYSYYYGYNQRAETIPLTRSKQERNLKLLANMVSEVKALGLDENFQEEFADAFIRAHSQAEVWRIEALTSVFGETSELDAGTITSLLRRMRQNLALLWPNPKLQEQAKTNRKDKELIAQIFKGYAAAKNLCLDALNQHPDDWALKLQLASIKYEESNYKAGLASHPEHSTTKAFALEDLAAAASDYISTLPLEDEDEESTEAFTTWFYAALGSPDLAALKAEHQPIQAEFAKIKAALESIPESSRQRHLDDFANTLNSRLANVKADLKYRFLEAALQITGKHERIEEAARVFEYYQDLITEIELDVHLDGPDQIDAGKPFGLFVNLRHTKEIERESGGFQRYLINQNNSPYSYNYGRPTEDYRDKFEKGARSVLEEHFEILSLTFHNSKVTSRTDAQDGWTVTPYAYFLLKPKGPEIDAVPPLKIDLDFLDTSGYVVLPIASAAIPIDASGETPERPYRDLSLAMILDQRETEKEGNVTLEIRASGHGLVPAIEKLIKLPIEGFKIASTDDRELQVDELDARTDDGAPISTHEWRLVLEPKSENLPKNFTFPEVLANLSTADDEGLTLQKYEDVDLVAVEQTTPIQGGSSKSPPYFLLISLLIPVVCVSIYFLFFKKREQIVIQNGPELPGTLTPVSLLAFLEGLLRDTQLSKEARGRIQKSIQSLKDRSFGPGTDVPNIDELREIAKGSIKPLQQAG